MSGVTVFQEKEQAIRLRNLVVHSPPMGILQDSTASTMITRDAWYGVSAVSLGD